MAATKPQENSQERRRATPIPQVNSDSSLAEGEGNDTAGSGRAKGANALGENTLGGLLLDNSTDSFWDRGEKGRRGVEGGRLWRPLNAQQSGRVKGEEGRRKEIHKSLTRESLDIDSILSGVKGERYDL